MIDNLFLSVGAMKAGTTWLYHQLREHPDIYFTPQKEIHYFANKAGVGGQLNYRNRILKMQDEIKRRIDWSPKAISENICDISWYVQYANAKDIDNKWYESLFSMREKKSMFCADFSNLYCHMGIDGWKYAHEVSKNIKVVYTLRDPVSRLWSHYKFHMKWMNNENNEISVGYKYFKNLLERPSFWANAEYAKNYNSLCESLLPDNVMILYFEDFRNDPISNLKKVQEFIGVDEHIPKNENINRKVNKTREISLPEEWKHHMFDKLYDECERMRKIGIWHPSWSLD
ncbi:sulfotransferase [Halomonas binhaiensis]|uniref:Sulfotransferase n=1 Tax=Halomonas binhaiensis TaxID=2562282 RepID=A0A856QJM7_9GAMM|nr:sulfotransferase [Halomonas binhaiensis]QEM80120.2 sulfotransferase [Halomonas binhaiensis]